MAFRKTSSIPFGAIIHSGDAGAILSRSWMTILHDLGITIERYHALMTRYITRVVPDPNRNVKVEIRQALAQELMKSSITWKTFVRGLDFLNVEEYEVGVHCKLEDQSFYVSEHSQEFRENVVGTILANLMFQVMERTMRTPEETTHRLDVHQKRTYGKKKVKASGSVRSALLKEMTRENITIKNFIKGLSICGCNEVILEYVLHHANGRTTKHQVQIEINGEK